MSKKLEFAEALLELTSSEAGEVAIRPVGEHSWALWMNKGLGQYSGHRFFRKVFPSRGVWSYNYDEKFNLEGWLDKKWEVITWKNLQKEFN